MGVASIELSSVEEFPPICLASSAGNSKLSPIPKFVSCVRPEAGGPSEAAPSPPDDSREREDTPIPPPLRVPSVQRTPDHPPRIQLCGRTRFGKGERLTQTKSGDQPAGKQTVVGTGRNLNSLSPGGHPAGTQTEVGKGRTATDINLEMDSIRAPDYPACGMPLELPDYPTLWEKRRVYSVVFFDKL
ncbi:hypothetical protein RND71_023369 [Anisodus tanguticus]|uniref:Uncharacterized protein n=1 Tax=Anisodus tanguticus TaxID=243964 RepID=A0AAE1VDQ2_9SOLA|nr:hypothetical protein RND71_023369 [Anisodus tanguticus]